MKKIVKCDKSILNILQKTAVEEIDFLVDVLTDNGAGRVALSSSIKDLLLHQKVEKKYDEDGLRNLLHELQEYGGHSVINFFRKEPLSYDDLLTDVYKKLNGKEAETKDRRKKEREIVLSLFGNDWKTMNAHDRWERCTEIHVVSGFFDLNKSLSFNNDGLAFGLSAAASTALFVALRMLPPAAIAATLGTAFQSVSEAYRITIPFIAQIARIKLLNEKP